MSKINSYMSQKIFHVKFICAILVISIHMYDPSMRVFEKLYYEQWFEDWWSQGVARIAVPLFFFMSGYLAFASRSENLTFVGLARELPQKLLRLIIPFWVWNILYWLWSIALDLLFSRPITITFGFIVRALFIYGCNAPFWYIFQLIFLVALTPFLFVITKNRVLAMVFCCICACGFVFIPGNQERFLLPGLLFYSIGAILFLHFNGLTKKCGGGGAIIASSIFIALLLWRINLTDMSKNITDLLPTWRFKAFDILTPFAFWFAIDLFKIGKVKVLNFEKETFFIYALHSMLLTGTGIAIKVFMGSFAVSFRLIIYCILPIIVAIICILAAKGMRKIPFLYALLTGDGLTIRKKKQG